MRHLEKIIIPVSHTKKNLSKKPIVI